MSRVYAGLALRAAGARNSEDYLKAIRNSFSDLTTNANRLSYQDAQNLINMIAERYDDQTLYNFAVRKLVNGDKVERQAVYDAMKDDVLVPRRKLDKYTAKGTKNITYKQSQRLVTDTLARKIAFENLRNSNFKRNIENSAYSGGSKKSKIEENGEIMKEITNNEPALIGWKDEQNEITDLVLRDANLSVVKYGGGQINIPKIEISSNATSLFRETAKEVIFNPIDVDSGWLEEKAAAISQGYRRENPENMSILSTESIVNLMTTLRDIVPIIDKAETNKENMQKSLGKVVLLYGTGQNEAGLNELLYVTSALTKSTNFLLQGIEKRDKNLQSLKETAETKWREENEKNIAAEGTIGTLMAEKDKLALEVRESKYSLKEAEIKLKGLEESNKKLLAEIKEQEAEFKELNRKQALENENNLKAQAKKDADSIKRAEEEKQLLIEKFNSANEIILQNNETIRTLRGQIDDFESIIRRGSAKISAATNITGEIGTLINKAVEMLVAAQTSNSQYKSDIEQLNRVIENLREKDKTQTEVIEKNKLELQNQLSTLKTRETEIKLLKGSVAENEENVAVFKDLARVTQARLDDQLNQMSLLQGELRAAKENSAEQQKLKVQIEGLSEQIKKDRQTREENQTKILELEATNSKMKSQIDSYEANVSLLQGKISDCNTQAEALKRGIEEANAAKEALQKTLDAKTIELTQCNLRLTEMSQNIANAVEQDAQIKKLEGIISRNGKLVEESQKEIDRIKVLKSKDEQRITELQSALDEMKKNAQSNKEEYEKSIYNIRQQYEQELFLSKQNLKVRESELQRLQQELEKAQNERMAVEDEHQNAVIVANTNPPTIPLEVVNQIANAANVNAGLPQQPFPQVKIPPSGSVIIPDKENYKKRDLARAGYDVIPSKRVRRSKFVTNSTVKQVAKSRARNTASGGYVVGGRPDPYISPQGSSFWKNVYRSHYHLF